MTFEDGSLKHPASGADLSVGTVTLETTAPLNGSYAARLPNATNSYLQENFTPADELYVSFYVRLAVLPASDARIALIQNVALNLGSLWLRNGALQLRDGSTVLGESGPLSVNTLYRVGLRQKLGTGDDAVLEGYLANARAGVDFDLATPFARTVSGTWTAQASRLRLGQTSGNTPLDATFDDIMLDTATMPLPSIITPVVTSTPTGTPESTSTPTDVPTPADTATPTPTNIPEPTPTETPEPTATNTPTPTNTPIPVTLTFRADADARVAEEYPTTNYGLSGTLRVDGGTGPDWESYLGFAVTGVTGSLQRATLRVYAPTATNNGPAVYVAGNEWSETRITWDTRPVGDATAVADSGAVLAYSWVEYDVTPAITGDGSYTFVLATDTVNGLLLSSRQGTMQPELVLTFSPATALASSTQ